MNIVKDLRTLFSPRALILHDAYMHLLNLEEAKDSEKLDDLDKDLQFVMDIRDYTYHKMILLCLDSEPRVRVELPRSIYNEYLRHRNYGEFVRSYWGDKR